jgi:hypothetical protein
MTTLEEARSAKEKIKRRLLLNFNRVSRPPVNFVGISKDAEGHFVSIGMERPPTPAESAELRETCDGVRVKYQIVGTISAL